jgi:hypothetical protein
MFMEEMKQRLLAIEEQVSSIKDPNLKKIAFEKLLDRSLGVLPVKMSKKNVTQHTNKKMGSKKTSSSQHYSDSLTEENIKKLNISGSLHGMPKFKACKSKLDCYLWVLAYAKHNKIEGLNNHEIAYVMTKKLFKNTKYTTVFGIRKKVKEGLVINDPDTNKWIITPDGEDYLKTLDSGE